MTLPSHLIPVMEQVQRLISDPRIHEQWQSRIRQWTESDEVKPRFEEIDEFGELEVEEGREEIEDLEGIEELGKLEGAFVPETKELDRVLVPVTVKYFYDDPSPLPLIPRNPSLEYKFAILGAVNDVAKKDDITVVALNPFPSSPSEIVSDEEQAAFIRGMSFWTLMSRVSEIESVGDVKILNRYMEDIRGELVVEGAVIAEEENLGIAVDTNAEKLCCNDGLSTNDKLRTIDVGHESANEQISSPSDDAIQCYRAHFATGMNQTALADLLTSELKRTISQGQVSRWIKQVKDWISAGNVLPEFAELTSQPKSIDPSSIDIGKRQDSRTPRQRQKRSEDSGD